MGHLDLTLAGTGTFTLLTWLSILAVLVAAVGVIVGIGLTTDRSYRWLGIALIPVGLVAGFALLLPAGISQANSQQHLQAAAKQTYGIVLNDGQAGDLMNFPKSIFNSRHNQTVETPEGNTTLAGIETISYRGKLQQVQLYITPDGNYHLGTTVNGVLTELPKKA
jgi:hypothetical protein